MNLVKFGSHDRNPAVELSGHSPCRALTDVWRSVLIPLSCSREPSDSSLQPALSRRRFGSLTLAEKVLFRQLGHVGTTHDRVHHSFAIGRQVGRRGFSARVYLAATWQRCRQQRRRFWLCGLHASSGRSFSMRSDDECRYCRRPCQTC